ncbi:MAG: hypothetical protein MAG431_01206 [Chloroflexi bacterium]|nr:hypothetical protein [Chloroflexota bacterium]
MKIIISKKLLHRIHAHGEETYPDEGAGLLLGQNREDARTVSDILMLDNIREDSARHNRYMLAPEDMLRAEEIAAERGLDVIGVFHSHPDHPNRPSAYDREWALPWFSYLITSVNAGEAVESHSWRLTDDRSTFEEESIQVKS